MTEIFIRPDARFFLDMLESMGRPPLQQLTALQLRENLNQTRALVEFPPPPLETVRDIMIPGPAGEIPARLFDPREEKAAAPMVVFFHGGGWVFGDLDSHARLCADIAIGLNLPVVAVDYRLAPEAVWPAAPDDCEAATRWLASSPEMLDLEVTGIILCGDSAGGNLAAITAAALRDSPADVPVLAQALLYPATDVSKQYPSNQLFGEGYYLTQDSLDWFIKQYGADVNDARMSPALGNLEGLPPSLVVAAGLDPLRDQARAYAQELINQGVETVYYEAKGNVHGFASIRKIIPSSEEDIHDIIGLLYQLISAKIFSETK
uniref:Hydrolase fold protein n=1 Tax=uncultured bacterium TB157_p TaxID=1552133 RepID=A0A0K0LBF4_9BACT|nr:hydrolase fold protein [uncultured bacterium TB157_p]